MSEGERMRARERESESEKVRHIHVPLRNNSNSQKDIQTNREESCISSTYLLVNDAEPN